MKRTIIGLSFLFNVLVAAIVVYLWSGGAIDYFRTNMIQPMHERWVSQFDEFSVEPADTVFLGDSITEGGSWHELFPGRSVRNRGIGGDTSAGVLARLAQVAEGKPGQVFLLIGTNDLSFGTSQEEIVANISQIVDELHESSPTTEVFVQSVLPRKVEYQERIEALNRALEPAVSGRATWINLYPLFIEPEDGSIRDSFSNDELHLLGAGYLVWRDAISHLVKR